MELEGRGNGNSITEILKLGALCFNLGHPKDFKAHISDLCEAWKQMQVT